MLNYLHGTPLHCMDVPHLTYTAPRLFSGFVAVTPKATWGSGKAAVWSMISCVGRGYDGDHHLPRVEGSTLVIPMWKVVLWWSPLCGKGYSGDPPCGKGYSSDPLCRKGYFGDPPMWEAVLWWSPCVGVGTLVIPPMWKVVLWWSPVWEGECWWAPCVGSGYSGDPPLWEGVLRWSQTWLRESPTSDCLEVSLGLWGGRKGLVVEDSGCTRTFSSCRGKDGEEGQLFPVLPLSNLQSPVAPKSGHCLPTAPDPLTASCSLL